MNVCRGVRSDEREESSSNFSRPTAKLCPHLLPDSFIRNCGGFCKVSLPGTPLALVGQPAKELLLNSGAVPRKIRELIRDLETAGFVNRGVRGDHRKGAGAR